MHYKDFYNHLIKENYNTSGYESDPNILLNLNFKKWFGNSRVVDNKGNPLIVYHKTPHVFSVFQQFSHSHFGFHFGNLSQASSAEIGGNRMIEAYLRIENPLKIDDLEEWQPVKLIDELDRLIKLTHVEKEECLSCINIIKSYNCIKNILQNHGYDGLVYENMWEGPGISWCALEPNQIKAVDNNGNFSMSDPDIYKEENDK